MYSNTTTILRPFIRDYPGEPLPEETFTHPPSWWSSILHQLLPSTMIHSILPVQITCLAIFLHSLSPCRLWSLDLEPSTSYSIHFFTQSVSSFCNTSVATCFPVVPRLYNLFLVFLSPPCLELLSFTLTSHIHLTIRISARWSATSFSFLTGQVSLPCSILLCTQLLYSLPLLINDISLLVSSDTNCLNLFHPVQILASTAASASPSTFNISPR